MLYSTLIAPLNFTGRSFAKEEGESEYIYNDDTESEVITATGVIPLCIEDNADEVEDSVKDTQGLCISSGIEVSLVKDGEDQDASRNAELEVDEDVTIMNQKNPTVDSTALVPVPPLDPCSSSSSALLSQYADMPTWTMSYLALHEQLTSTYTGTDEDIRIPDTIVFRQSIPIAWYCTPNNSIGVFRLYLF